MNVSWVCLKPPLALFVSAISFCLLFPSNICLLQRANIFSGIIKFSFYQSNLVKFNIVHGWRSCIFTELIAEVDKFARKWKSCISLLVEWGLVGLTCLVCFQPFSMFYKLYGIRLAVFNSFIFCLKISKDLNQNCLAFSWCFQRSLLFQLLSLSVFSSIFKPGYRLHKMQMFLIFAAFCLLIKIIKAKQHFDGLT